MLQCFVHLSVVCNVCIAAKRCVLKQKLLLTAWAYRKSYMRNRLVPKMNDLDLCLEVFKVISIIASYSPLIYRKPLEIEAWFQMTTNRKWPTGNNQIVTWFMTSYDPERSMSPLSQPQYFAKVQYLENSSWRCCLAVLYQVLNKQVPVQVPVLGKQVKVQVPVLS